MEKLIEQVKSLTARLKEIDAEQAAILNEANEKQDGQFTDEQAAKYDSLQAEYDGKTKELADASKDLARHQARANRVIPSAVAPRQTSHEVSTPLVTSPVNRIPATVRRGGRLQHFAGDIDGRSAEERAYRFGQYCLARISQQLPGHYHFAEALQVFDDNRGHWLTAHQSNNATGAYNLVPEEFGRDMIDLRESRGVVRQLFKRVTMTSDTRTDPRRLSGLTAYFVGEGAAGTESNKTWDNVRLTAKDVMVLSRMSAQLSADAVISIGDDLMGEIAYAFADKEDECGINGTGTSTYGGIVGVRSKLQDVDGAGTDSAGLVTGTGNLYSELTLTDFEAVVGKLPQYADTNKAAWVAHRAFYSNVMLKLALASGGVPAAEVQQGDRRPRPMFLGYPVVMSQVMPSAEANSQVCALLGDFARAASFGDRQQESISFSEHATVGGESVFERNQIAVRGTERFDINVHDVGTSAAAGPVVGLQTAAS